MNRLVFKGISSEVFSRLVIQELPPITKPPMRYSTTTIDGVDGDIVEELGYGAYDKEVSIGLKANDYESINSIIEYFSGSGDVIFGNEPDKVYKATIVEQIDYSRLAKFRTAKVKFHVQPYKYDIEDTYITVSNGNSIFNYGNVESKPLFHLSGTGTVTFKKNDISIFSYNFGSTASEVYIDSDSQDAYLGNTLKNTSMNGDFITLDTGSNKISWEGGTLTKCEMIMRARWL